MRLSLNTGTKIGLVIAFVILSALGFMLKLPSVFRHVDKELHTAFYFLAAAFLNLLFTNQKISMHLLIFIALYLFGVSIEYAQEYSNKLLHVKIHGRYDPEDIEANLKGLVLFSVLWFFYVVISVMYRKTKERGNIQE